MGNASSAAVLDSYIGSAATYVACAVVGTHLDLSPQPKGPPVRTRLEQLGRVAERLLDGVDRVLDRGAYNLGLHQAPHQAPAHMCPEPVEGYIVQAVAAREAERRRIRREIHDGIGPLLAAALLRTEIAMELPLGSPMQAEALRKLHKLQKTAIADFQGLLEGLRPPALERGDLLTALRQHADLIANMAAENPPTIDFDISEDISRLTAAVEIAAYRITQESISNAIKHAYAQHITIRITRASDSLTIEIDDDGIGVTADNPLGVGLISMGERAAELGGWCVVTHRPTGGTHVKTWLPIIQQLSMRRRESRSLAHGTRDANRQWLPKAVPSKLSAAGQPESLLNGRVV